jgi:hypothetical protein
MNDNVCPLCGEAILPNLLTLHTQLEKTWLRELKETNPQWFVSEKIPSQCLEEFKVRHENLRKEATQLCYTGDYSRKIGFIDNKEGEIEDEVF